MKWKETELGRENPSSSQVSYPVLSHSLFSLLFYFVFDNSMIRDIFIYIVWTLLWRLPCLPSFSEC